MNRAAVKAGTVTIIAASSLATISLAGCHRQSRDHAPSTVTDTTAADSSAPPAASSGSQTGASSSIESDEIRNSHAVRVEDLLSSQPGVQISHRNDGSVSIRIRGAGSVIGSGEPLFVLDGSIISVGGDGVLRGLTPRDILRIEILRDAGSTALYGSRGANGVILITTRRP